MESHVSRVALRDLCPEKHLPKDSLAHLSYSVYSKDEDCRQLEIIFPKLKK